MRNYYLLKIKFKDESISKEIHSAQLYIDNDIVYMRIFFEITVFPTLDIKYLENKKTLGLFENDFEIVESPIKILFDKSRIYRGSSYAEEDGQIFFTIYLSKICLITKIGGREPKKKGVAYLNNNALQIANYFHTSFSNHNNKDIFENARNRGMEDYYKIDKMSFRLELEYSSNEERKSEEFTVKKIPTIYFKHEGLSYREVRNRISIICNFISFCYGIRIFAEKLIFSTDIEKYTFRDNEPNYKTYLSWTLPVFQYLNKNCRFELILKSDWYSHYSLDNERITNAINSYLHSREVSKGSAFLLLFNVLELFKENSARHRFKMVDNKEKKEIFKTAFDEIKKVLKSESEEDEFKKKWDVLTANLSYRPFMNVFEETLENNNIDSKRFGSPLKDLKKTRDDLTHGSVKINDKELQEQVYCMRRIAAVLILNNLGFQNDIKEKFNWEYGIK